MLFLYFLIELVGGFTWKVNKIQKFLFHSLNKCKHTHTPKGSQLSYRFLVSDSHILSVDSQHGCVFLDLQ